MVGVFSRYSLSIAARQPRTLACFATPQPGSRSTLLTCTHGSDYHSCVSNAVYLYTCIVRPYALLNISLLCAHVRLERSHIFVLGLSDIKSDAQPVTTFVSAHQVAMRLYCVCTAHCHTQLHYGTNGHTHCACHIKNTSCHVYSATIQHYHNCAHIIALPYSAALQHALTAISNVQFKLLHCHTQLHWLPIGSTTTIL